MTEEQPVESRALQPWPRMAVDTPEASTFTKISGHVESGQPLELSPRLAELAAEGRPVMDREYLLYLYDTTMLIIQRTQQFPDVWLIGPDLSRLSLPVCIGFVVLVGRFEVLYQAYRQGNPLRIIHCLLRYFEVVHFVFSNTFHPSMERVMVLQDDTIHILISLLTNPMLTPVLSIVEDEFDEEDELHIPETDEEVFWRQWSHEMKHMLDALMEFLVITLCLLREYLIRGPYV